MFVKAIKKIQKSMFPIFRINKISDKEKQIAITGTGFFIDTKGTFVTVSHIFDNADKNSEFVYIGRLPEEVLNPHLKIEELGRDDSNDIFVGKINLEKTKPIVFAKGSSSVGQSVCISGYPLAHLRSNNQGGIVIEARRYFQPTFILDRLVTQSKGGDGKTRTHDGVLIRDFGLFGMSGGPVFDTKGRVIAMQASVTEPRSSSNGQRTIKVENAVAIRGNLIYDVVSQVVGVPGFMQMIRSKFNS